MLNRRQAIAAACGAVASAAIPAPSRAVSFVIGPLLYNHDASAWIDAETLRIVLSRQEYPSTVLPPGWEVKRIA